MVSFAEDSAAPVAPAAPAPNAGAAWAAAAHLHQRGATAQDRMSVAADLVGPIPVRVRGLCAEIGVDDPEIEAYVVSMLEVQVYDQEEADLATIAELLAGYCEVGSEVIHQLLVSIA
jgi:hypothetical protein